MSTHNAHAADQQLNASQLLGCTVVLVCRALADRYERFLLNKDTRDRLDHHVRVLLLAHGPEGRAEIVTVLSLEHAL
ncbi:hypothetical protein [Streptomyces cavourensis]|uniref:Uncharacterized protein n=1 Tax=Streptomyces cavourensis TaxID=67258 RepID=A0ABY5FIN8_9ACTN|nr:hypothetical protein [Streptomyces cavourensis]UTR83581.1 hypothetical protein NLU04_34270 [Streptomyces cavourensis]